MMMKSKEAGLRVFSCYYSSGCRRFSQEEISYIIVAKNKDQAMELALNEKTKSVKYNWKIEEIDTSFAGFRC